MRLSLPAPRGPIPGPGLSRGPGLYLRLVTGGSLHGQAGWRLLLQVGLELQQRLGHQNGVGSFSAGLRERHALEPGPQHLQLTLRGERKTESSMILTATGTQGMLPLGTPISLLLGRLVSSWRTGNKVPHTTTSATDFVSWAREAESGPEAAPTQAQGSVSGQAAASSALQGEGPTPSLAVSPRERGSSHPAVPLTPAR